MFDTVVVIAARDASVKALRGACPPAVAAAVRASNGWAHAAVSFVTADLAALEGAAAKVAAPTLVVQTKPGGADLVVRGAKGKSTRLEWTWSLARPSVVAKLSEQYGGDLAKLRQRKDLAVPAKAKKLSFAAGVALALEEQVGELGAAIEKAGLGDAKKVEAVTGATTAGELESALGPVPRLLDAIGLGDVVPGWRAAAEGGFFEPPVDEVAPLLERIGATSPVSGSFSLLLEDLPLLPRMLALADSESLLGLRVTGIADPNPFRRAALHVTTAPGAVSVAFPCSDWKLRDQGVAQMRELVPALAGLPPGAELDAVTRRTAKAARGLRFAGPLREGAWHVTRSTPGLDAAVLDELLRLARATESGAALEVKGEAETAAIAARMKWNQGYWKAIARDGDRWSAGPGFTNEFLAQVLVELRHGALLAPKAPA